MKNLFMSVLTLVVLAGGVSHAEAEDETNVLCDVRHWALGKEVVNMQNVALVLKADERDDFPVDPDYHYASLATPAGKVYVGFNQTNLSISYNHVLGEMSGTVIGEGPREAKLTVFLGPKTGHNNGLTVSCRVTTPQARAAKTPAPRMTDIKPWEDEPIFP